MNGKNVNNRGSVQKKNQGGVMVKSTGNPQGDQPYRGGEGWRVQFLQIVAILRFMVIFSLKPA